MLSLCDLCLAHHGGAQGPLHVQMSIICNAYLQADRRGWATAHLNPWRRRQHNNGRTPVQQLPHATHRQQQQWHGAAGA
jgi:hypothetical protein